MSLLWFVIVVLVLLSVLGAPGVGPWTHNYGYYPSGGIGLIVIILIVLLISGRL